MNINKATSMPNIYVLFGYPLKFTLSPIIHNTIFNNGKENSFYYAQPVKKEDIKQAIESMKAFSWSGANVTIPHKQSVIELLDLVDESALKIGAVNTIVNSNNRLMGFNTDVLGFQQTLPKELDKNSEIVILGAGGAALAIVYSLIEMNFSKITIVNRTPQNTSRFIGKVAEFNKTAIIRSIDWNDLNENDLCNKEAIINCTPLDFPFPDNINTNKILNDVTCVYDLRYGLKDNSLLQLAKDKGTTIILDGLAMLIWQALFAQKIWRGVTPDPNIVKEALSQWV